MARESHGDRRLIFVYDLDAPPAGVVDGVRSLVRTGSTGCRLHDLIHHRLPVQERAWKRFVDDLPYRVTYETRSTFRRTRVAPPGARSPAVWLDTPAGLVELLDADDVTGAADLEALQRLLSEAVGRVG